VPPRFDVAADVAVALTPGPSTELSGSAAD